MRLYVAARVDGELHGGAGAAGAAGQQTAAAAVPEYVTDDPVLLQLTLDLLFGRGVGLPSPAQRGRQHRLLYGLAEVVSAGAGR